MPFTPKTIESSYRDCRQISRRAGSNFHAGFLLLPHEKRRAMEAVYAFMRHTDDLADAPCLDVRPSAKGDSPIFADTKIGTVPNVSPREALAAWRSELQRSLDGDATCTILPAVTDAVARFHIPPEHLFAVIDGVEMDLDRPRYETFDDLRPYCEHVASAVGMACIHIWGFRGPEAFEPARQAGIAMQLTNILRDLKEDADVGRVYLPLADLRECDYRVEDLLSGVADKRFHRLIAMEVARAEAFYTAGTELMEWLEPVGQRMFGLMMATYRSLLRTIASRPSDVFRRRVRLSGVQRIQLAARWCLLPPRKDALG